MLAVSVAFARGGGTSSKQPADVVPYGEEWSCFHFADPKTPSSETPRCERTESACKLTRGRLIEPDKMSSCAPQQTATVVTYFDPKRASWRFLASPDDDGCLALRAGLVRTKAYQKVAQCEVVGKRLPPPAKLELSAITPGKSWWCLELPTPAPRGARPVCTRTVAGCEEMIRRDSMVSTKCKERSSAYVVTFKDASTTWGYGAMATSEACTSYRDRAITAASSLSACTPVGDVARPKLDRKKLPRGSSWVCFLGADPQHRIGSCARTAKDCEAQYELDRYVLGASEGCKSQSSAVARNYQDQVFAFPTAALCEQHVTQHPDGSQCEAVN